LRPHASCTPVETKKKLIQTFILTHINYSNIVFAQIDAASARKLGVAYNACLRYIHGLQRRDSMSELQNSITGLTLKASATLQILKFLFKFIHSQHPSYIFSLLQYSSSQRTNNPNLPVYRRNAMAQSFVVVATRTWNDLPYVVKSIETLGRFINAVRARLA
jgi:hypothetical protein